MKTVTAVTNVENTTQTINGAQILVEMLVRLGVETIYAYPGGASMPLHQALREQREQIRTILPRHEQGGCFATQGIARATGKIGVVMGTSGPGATNLVTGIADAKLDSIPMICITGQVPQAVIGSDAFQETPMVEVCGAITKHQYMITDVRDVARVMKEAYHIAMTGRPGPVLVDVPKDVQNWRGTFRGENHLPIPGYRQRQAEIEGNALTDERCQEFFGMLAESKRPLIYAGGGVINGNASAALRALAGGYKIPVASTLMGLGGFDTTHPLSLHMLGMHGAAFANYAVEDCDALIAVGAGQNDARHMNAVIEAFRDVDRVLAGERIRD